MAKIYGTRFRYHGEAPTLDISQASLEAALAKTELSNSIDFLTPFHWSAGSPHEVEEGDLGY